MEITCDSFLHVIYPTLEGATKYYPPPLEASDAETIFWPQFPLQECVLLLDLNSPLRSFTPVYNKIQFIYILSSGNSFKHVRNMEEQEFATCKVRPANLYSNSLSRLTSAEFFSTPRINLLYQYLTKELRYKPTMAFHCALSHPSAIMKSLNSTLFFPGKIDSRVREIQAVRVMSKKLDLQEVGKVYLGEASQRLYLTTVSMFQPEIQRCMNLMGNRTFLHAQNMTVVTDECVAYDPTDPCCNNTLRYVVV